MFIFALVGFTFSGWIGWVGMILLLLRIVGVIYWPWWLAALPLEYGVIYSVYMTIDGALHRGDFKGRREVRTFYASPVIYSHKQLKIKEIIAEGPERIGEMIDAWSEDPNRRFLHRLFWMLRLNLTFCFS